MENLTDFPEDRFIVYEKLVKNHFAFLIEHQGVIYGPPRIASKIFMKHKEILLPYIRPWGEIFCHLGP